MVDVTDMVQPTIATESVMTRTADELGPGGGGRIEVWGLTGWYLSLLMKILQVYG